MDYFDWAATAEPDREIYEKAQQKALENWGNPSSLHQKGKECRNIFNEFRKRAAKALQCKPEQLILTSGGTESNNLVILSLLNRTSPGEIILSSLEHPSASEPAKALSSFGAKVNLVQPDKSGRFVPGNIAKRISPETRLIVVMGVHNTTGVIQPIQEIAACVREESKGRRPIHIHCDLVQAQGKIPFNLKEWDIDSASFSGHKTGAPRGAGLLYLKQAVPTLNYGGGQERGLRSGTESLQNMVAMALSLEKGIPGGMEELSSLFILELRKALPQVVFNPPARETHPEFFAPHIVNFSIPPLPGEVLHRILDIQGMALSHGSACAANGRKKPEDLHSMGIHPKIAHCSVRASMGPTTSREQVLRLVDCIKKEVQKLGM